MEAFPLHRFITRTDDSFQATAGHLRLPEQRRKESASSWRVRRARIGAESCGCRFVSGKIRVKCSEQFRTKCFRLDSRKRHEPKTSETQKWPLFTLFSCRFHESTRKWKIGRPACPRAMKPAATFNPARAGALVGQARRLPYVRLAPVHTPHV
jgi:hypothetical protein